MFDFLTPTSLFDPQSPAYETGQTSGHGDTRDNDAEGFDGFMQSIGDLGRGIQQEGIGALLDPFGAIDRQDAQRDLASRFTVVDDDHEGPRLPNQLTQEEYQQVARDFSNIRMGRSDIEIDASTAAKPEEYTEGVMNDIADIMQSESGRDLIRRLGDNEDDHKTTLQPFLKADGTPDHTNAFESADSSPGNGSPFADGRPGQGTDTSVSFNPQHDIVPDANNRFRSDVVLYHELTHALHDVEGTTDMNQVQANDDVLREMGQGDFFGAFDAMLNPSVGVTTDAPQGLSRFEHQAAGLGLYADNDVSENQYRAERNQIALSGQGRAGDLLMPHRETYTGDSVYHPFFGM